MSDKKVVDYLKKEHKWEEYLFIFCSFVVVIVGALILTGNLEIKESQGLLAENPKAFAWVLILIGSAGAIYGIIKNSNEVKYRKKSVYYELKKESEDNLKNKFSILSCDKIEIDNLSYVYIITITIGNVEFMLEVMPKETSMLIDVIPDDDNIISDEEYEKIDELTKTFNSTEISKDELISKFINFINTNLDVVNNYGKKC